VARYIRNHSTRSSDLSEIIYDGFTARKENDFRNRASLELQNALQSPRRIRDNEYATLAMVPGAFSGPKAKEEALESR